MTLRIAIVAGEASGDLLGADLIRALKRQHADIHFEGIGGPQMVAEGFNSLYPMERLAVMGLVEPLKRLPELLRMRKQLRQRYCQHPPDLFLGIDAPDFNLDLELALRQSGVTTAHYVSPSVWAWRQKRVEKIARAVDLMLTLFPHEARFYQQHQVPVTFVGHPLAESLPLQTDAVSARKQLGIELGQPVLAVLPGSRASEVEKLAVDFLAAAQLCRQHIANLQIVIPAANEQRFQQLQALLQQCSVPVTLLQGQSRTVMAAADAVLLASGTSTLEAMLLKKPMVVGYRVAPLSYALLKRLVKSEWISLPNILAGKTLVPELIQDAATPEALAEALLARLQGAEAKAQISAFTTLHQQLQAGGSELAAQQLLSLIEQKCSDH